MIRVLVRPAGADEFNPIPAAGIDALDPADRVWVDIQDGDPDSVASALGALGMGLHHDGSPHSNIAAPIIEEPQSLEMAVPIFSVEQDGGLISASLKAYLSERGLITVHSGGIEALDRVWESTDRSPKGPTTMASLCSLLMSAISRQVVPLIEGLERRIDGLEDLAFAADPRTLTEVQALRRDVITLRRVLNRQRDLADDLSLRVHPALGEGGRDAFRRTSDHDGRLVDLLDSARNLLQSVSETYRGAVADQTNEIVRLLTVFSAIMLPLGLIAGIFGMNFASIPASDQQWGFWVSIGLMVAIAVALWIFFARRGFIGAPRLRDLPKAVGLGIVSVGTAPVRALASGVESTIHHLTPRRRDSRDADNEA